MFASVQEINFSLIKMRTSIKLCLLAIGSLGLGLAAWTQQSTPNTSQPETPTGTAGQIGIAPTTAVNTNQYSPSSDKAEAASCKKNLETINAAIQAYRNAEQNFPNALSDLVPKYLADTNVLICPVTKRTGNQSPFGVLDPKIYCSYLYEFGPTEIPAVVKGAWPGPKMTMREWKQQQMKRAGSNVPIVRCLLHDPALNLSVGGTVYESPVFWELNFTNASITLSDFTPH